MIRPEDVKALREQTGAGIMDCKRALEQSAGDVEQAVAWLKEKGLTRRREGGGDVGGTDEDDLDGGVAPTDEQSPVDHRLGRVVTTEEVERDARHCGQTAARPRRPCACRSDRTPGTPCAGAWCGRGRTS